MMLPASFASDPNAYPVMRDINVQGEAAGYIQTNTTTAWYFHPVFWRTPAQPVELGVYNGLRTYAERLNNLGVVGGHASLGFDPAKALVWETSPPPPPTPTQRVAAVRGEIAKLIASGLLSAGDAESLLAKLDAVARAIEGQDLRPAKQILNATANQVSALQKSKRITQATADTFRPC